MDVKVGDLETLLARRLWEEGYGPGDAITVAELHRELVPYPLCREELDLATKAEYDVALLSLLQRGEALAMEDGRLAEAVAREMESPEPGLGLLGGYAASFLTVRLSPAAPEEEVAAGAAGGGDTEAEAGGAGSTNGASGPEGPEGAERAEGPAAFAMEPPDPAVLDDVMDHEDREAGMTGFPDEVEGGADSCLECGTELPRRPDLHFCPFCGADQSASVCRGCGTDLEPDWSFCPACGAAGA